MKKVTFYLSMMLLAVILLPSCKKGGKGMFTPTSSGRPYEVLVVMDKNTWEAPTGRALYNVLDTDVPGLPPSERSFRISQIPLDRLQRSFKIFRNIIIADIQPGYYTQPKLKFTRNAYASPQMILTIQAPNEESFAEFVEKNGQTQCKHNDHERHCIGTQLRNLLSKEAVERSNPVNGNKDPDQTDAQQQNAAGNQKVQTEHPAPAKGIENQNGKETGRTVQKLYRNFGESRRYHHRV